MVRAGLTKLNIQAKTATNSLKSMTASNLQNTQRAAGASYGILAQRSNMSIFNNKAYNSGSLSALRHQLNSRTIINNNYPSVKKHSDGMDTMGKIMMWASLGAMATQMGVGIAGAIKDMKGSDGAGSTSKDSTSLSDLNKQSDKIGKDVASFNESYKNIANGSIEKIQKSSSQFINSENSFINDNISKLNDTTNLKTNDLNLSTDSTLKNLQDASSKIGNDLADVDAYIKNLPTADMFNAANVSLDLDINRLDLEIANRKNNNLDTSDLEQKKQELEKQKEELKNFQTAVNNAKTEAGTIRENINKQKNELADLITQKVSNMNQIYEQAEKDNKAIADNNKKMESLAKKIGKEKNQNKKDSLIKEYNAYADGNIALANAITTAGGSNIQNASGTKISNLNQANTSHYTASAGNSNEDNVAES